MAIDYFSGVEYQPLSAGDLFGLTTPQNVSPAVDGHEALDGQYDELWANSNHRRTIGDAVELITKSPWHSRLPLMGCVEEVILKPLLAGKLNILYATDACASAETQDRPVALFNHLFLDEAGESAYLAGSRIALDDWLSGPEGRKLYVIDFIAPYKNAMALGRAIQSEMVRLYKGNADVDDGQHITAKFLRAATNGRGGYCRAKTGHREGAMQ